MGAGGHDFATVCVAWAVEGLQRCPWASGGPGGSGGCGLALTWRDGGTVGCPAAVGGVAGGPC